MPSTFPIQLSQNLEGYEMKYFTPDPARAFGVGDLVFFDTAVNQVALCGANPALILGVAVVPSTSAWLYEGRVPVATLTPDIILELAAAATPAVAHLGRDYGVTRDAAGHWRLDPANATARFTVTEIDPVNERFFCRPLAANLQLDAIAS